VLNRIVVGAFPMPQVSEGNFHFLVDCHALEVETWVVGKAEKQQLFTAISSTIKKLPEFPSFPYKLLHSKEVFESKVLCKF
jgi:hypothetical protein